MTHESTLQAHIEPVQSALGLSPDAESLARLCAIWNRIPSWVTQGYMPSLDAVVVHEAARAAAGGTIVEIGTGSGVSICAAALGAFTEDELPDTRIHTFDFGTQCYFDRSRPVGSAIGEMLPELGHHIHVHAGADTEDASGMFAEDSIDLAIIDGDHLHPLPMIDLALLSSALKPGAWVVLHDIRLPELEIENPDGGEPLRFPHTGAQRLYGSWPWEKIEPAPGVYVNIGLIRIPDTGLAPRQIAEMLDTTPFDDGVNLEYALGLLVRSGLGVADGSPV